MGQVPAVSGVSQKWGRLYSHTPLCIVVGVWVSWIGLWSSVGSSRAVWRLGWCWGTGLCWGDWEISSHLCLHSEAAPYLPAEEKSPLFSIQREGIKDDGALYRLNRCVMACPQAQQVFAACQAVPLLAWQCLSGCPQACLGPGLP